VGNLGSSNLLLRTMRKPAEMPGDGQSAGFLFSAVSARTAGVPPRPRRTLRLPAPIDFFAALRYLHFRSRLGFGRIVWGESIGHLLAGSLTFGGAASFCGRFPESGSARAGSGFPFSRRCKKAAGLLDEARRPFLFLFGSAQPFSTLGVLFLSMTSWLPPSTMLVEETTVRRAFSCSSGRESAPQLHMVLRTLYSVVCTPSASAPA
jgi:hypothetical protein